jgi:hypothetical protein
MGAERTDRSSAGEHVFGLVMAIIMHRHRNHGLLLSELGGYLLGPERCCAGTKRISKLRWSRVFRHEKGVC